MMVEYGMNEHDVLNSVTSVNAQVFELKKLGKIEEGMLADLVVIEGNPAEDISTLRKVKMVYKGGILVE